MNKFMTIIGMLSISFTAFAEVPRLDQHLQTLTGLFSLQLGEEQTLEVRGTLDGSQNPCLVTVYNHTKISQMFPEASKSTRGIQVSVSTDKSAGSEIATFSLTGQSAALKYTASQNVGASNLSYKVVNHESVMHAKRQSALSITRIVNANRTLVVQASDLDRKVSLSCRINSK